ncbi:phage tail assembly chaperone [Emcibacter sp.]|uniref:phage tail assembly chaperone n=1 Tax=Emcibacter sp. TaxID=1979954 RepID=UPI003A9077F1
MPDRRRGACAAGKVLSREASERILQAWAMIAFGLLGWSPGDFWRATPFDVSLVLASRQGYLDFWSEEGKPLGRQELAELREKLGTGH